MRVRYFSEFRDLPVVAPDGTPAGELSDLALMPEGDRPTIQWAIIEGERGERVIPWNAVVEEDGHLRLTEPLPKRKTVHLPPGALRMARDLVDRAIVDVRDAKAARINDLELAEEAGSLVVVGAEIGLRGMFRRLGVEDAAERVASLVGRRLAKGVIPWRLIQPPDTTGKKPVPLKKLSLIHPADLADIVEDLTSDEQRAVFEQIDVGTAADTLAEVEDERQAAIVADLEQERAADILEEMPPDVATDVLQDLPARDREDIIDLMEDGAAEDIAELLAYPESSAGGLMTTDVVGLASDLTAAQALERLRALRPDAALAYYVYVTGPGGRLAGVLSLRKLVTAPAGERIGALMEREVISVSVDANRDEVANTISRYDLLALAVVDRNGMLVGAVTVDDVVDLIRQEGVLGRARRLLRR